MLVVELLILNEYNGFLEISFVFILILGLLGE